MVQILQKTERFNCCSDNFSKYYKNYLSVLCLHVWSEWIGFGYLFFVPGYYVVGPRTKMKDLRSFVQVDVVSLMDGLDTVTQASMRAMIHSVTVQYLYRAGAKENDTFGRTGSISDVSFYWKSVKRLIKRLTFLPSKASIYFCITSHFIWLAPFSLPPKYPHNFHFMYVYFTFPDCVCIPNNRKPHHYKTQVLRVSIYGYFIAPLPT